MSFRTKLFLATAAAVVVTILLTVVVGAALVRRSVTGRAIDTLGHEADLAAVRIESAGSVGPQVLLPLNAALSRVGVHLVVLGPGAPPPPPFPLPPEIRASLDAHASSQGEASIGGTDYLYAIRPAGPLEVMLTRPSRLGVAESRPFLRSLLFATLVGVAVAAVASLLVARAVAKPVRRVADATQRLASGSKPERIPVEGSDELAALASSFNDMAERLARAQEAEQAFLLSVSHELKTPLTAIRGYGEGLSDGAVEAAEAGRVITREAERLERLVQDLLDLARLRRHAFEVRREPVDLAAMAREVVRRFEGRARGFGVTLSADTVEGAGAVGDGDRILQVASNLVENALRVTPSGGSVTVTARPGGIAVSDTGPGIAPEDVPRAFDRFYLHDRYRGERPVGSGLGLAIVKELTEAMGGSVSVESAEGMGATFRVTFTATTAATATTAVPLMPSDVASSR